VTGVKTHSSGRGSSRAHPPRSCRACRKTWRLLQCGKGYKQQARQSSQAKKGEGKKKLFGRRRGRVLPLLTSFSVFPCLLRAPSALANEFFRPVRRPCPQKHIDLGLAEHHTLETTASPSRSPPSTQWRVQTSPAASRGRSTR
jgi:hypothetical protein